MVGMLRRLGMTRFLAGSDWAPDFTVSDPRPFTPAGAILGLSADSVKETGYRPGLSVVEELVILVRAGLTPLEAVQAGTLNPAKFFEATDSLGTVAPGKLADLVLLDGDPLSDIRHVLQPRGVVANGRYFDRAALAVLDPKGSHGMLGDEPADAGVKPAQP